MNNLDASITIRLDKRLKEKFEKVCEETGFSTSQIVRDEIKDFLKKYEENKQELINTHLYR